MPRSSRWTGLLMVTGALMWSGCASSRAQVPRLATAPVAEGCDVEVEGFDLRDWRQIQADGFTFCAPSSWQRNERYDRIPTRRGPPGFASFSWAGPDTTYRVIFEVPIQDATLDQMRASFEVCQQSSQTARQVGDQEVCVFEKFVTYRYPFCPNMSAEVSRGNRLLPIANSLICPAALPRDWTKANVTIMYGQPLVKATVFGFKEGWAVAQTVRSAASASSLP